MFDWETFLTRHGIEYKPQYNRHIISIDCPFCGSSSKFHLGISLQGKGHHCWKDEISHSGRAPHRLIMALLNCSYEQAQEIVTGGSSGFTTSDESFLSDVMGRLGQSTKSYNKPKPTALNYLPEFKPFNRSGMQTKLVYPYLNKRGYTDDDIDELAEDFQLTFAMSGYYSYRIIVPIFFNKKLVTWTARSVLKDAELRYLSLSENPNPKTGLPPALMNIKDCLFDYDSLKAGGDILVAVEGPFDAMRLSFFGKEFGLKAACFFNTSPRDTQLDLLWTVSAGFKKRYVVFDHNAEFQAFNNIPSYMGFESLYLPGGVKDPALLDFSGFRRLFGI